jgi:hypothetical protein
LEASQGADLAMVEEQEEKEAEEAEKEAEMTRRNAAASSNERGNQGGMARSWTGGPGGMQFAGEDNNTALGEGETPIGGNVLSSGSERSGASGGNIAGIGSGNEAGGSQQNAEAAPPQNASGKPGGQGAARNLLSFLKPDVELSFVKVSGKHKRRRVGTMMFCALAEFQRRFILAMRKRDIEDYYEHVSEEHHLKCHTLYYRLLIDRQADFRSQLENIYPGRPVGSPRNSMSNSNSPSHDPDANIEAQRNFPITPFARWPTSFVPIPFYRWETPMRSLCLSVYSENFGAKALYKKLGFEDNLKPKGGVGDAGGQDSSPGSGTHADQSAGPGSSQPQAGQRVSGLPTIEESAPAGSSFFTQIPGNLLHMIIDSQ